MSTQPTISEILDKVRERVQARSHQNPVTPAVRRTGPVGRLRQSGFDFGPLRRELHSCNMLHNAVGELNPRRAGIHNQAIQLIKKAMRRSLAWYTRPLHAFHGAVTRTLNETTKALEVCLAQAHSLPQLYTALQSEKARVANLESRLVNLEQELHRVSVNLSVMANSPRNAGEAQVDYRTGTTLPFDYKGLQDRFRGPQEVICQRQSAYVELFRDCDNVLDVGSGRGEFLELLRAAGVSARGVDTDIDMVDVCRQKQLQVTHDDLFHALQNTPPASLGGMFCSQVIEHLPWTSQFMLVQLAREKLKVGAPVVIETINPECVVALVHNYFLDPTHVRPVHPELLRFVFESLGFSRVELRFSSPVDSERMLVRVENDAPRAIAINRGVDSVNSLLFGYQDYAVIAWR